MLVGGTALGSARGDFVRTVIGAFILVELTTILSGMGFGQGDRTPPPAWRSSCGSRPAARAGSDSRTAIAAASRAVSATKSTSSPSDFTTRPWLVTIASAAFSSNDSSSAASSLMSVCLTVLV